MDAGSVECIESVRGSRGRQPAQPGLEGTEACDRAARRRAPFDVGITMLVRGTTVEMILDRPVTFDESELSFGNYQPPHPGSVAPAPPAEKKTTAPVRRPFPGGD